MPRGDDEPELSLKGSDSRPRPRGEAPGGAPPSPAWGSRNSGGGPTHGARTEALRDRRRKPEVIAPPSPPAKAETAAGSRSERWPNMGDVSSEEK